VDETALAQALADGAIAGAATDVLTSEPPAAENPLLSAPRCLITPHIAWASEAARIRLIEISGQNIEAFLKGTPQNIVAAPRS
jgi:glycerate dehydrogenase